MKIAIAYLTPNQIEVLRATGEFKEETYDMYNYDGILKVKPLTYNRGYELFGIGESGEYIIDDMQDYETIKDCLIDPRIKIYPFQCPHCDKRYSHTHELTELRKEMIK